MINKTKLYKAAKLLNALDHDIRHRIIKVLLVRDRTYKELGQCLATPISAHLSTLVDLGLVIREKAPDGCVLFYANRDKLNNIKKAIKKFSKT